MSKQAVAILDILGISTASLCLVHCLIFPILSVFPFGLHNNHWIDLFFACIGMFVVSKIILSNTKKIVKIVLFISISMIITGVVFELHYDRETKLVVLGGFIMIIGHLLNFKYHKH